MCTWILFSTSLGIRFILQSYMGTTLKGESILFIRWTEHCLFGTDFNIWLTLICMTLQILLLLLWSCLPLVFLITHGSVCSDCVGVMHLPCWWTLSTTHPKDSVEVLARHTITHRHAHVCVSARVFARWSWWMKTSSWCGWTYLYR